MKFEEVNNKEVDSIILSLEQLTTDYENTLKKYNQVQEELNTFANSEWQLNPYLNKNIQFITGEIAYVTKSGSVFLYGFLPNLYNNITTDQGYVSMDQNIVNTDQNTVNNLQNTVNNLQNTVNTDIDIEIGLAVASIFSTAALAGAIYEGVEITDEENQLSGDQSQLSNAQGQLSSAQSQLSEEQSALNIAEANLQNALGQLDESGCPSTIIDLVQVNLPWLPEYNEPYNLIPTTPPLLTMGQFYYEYNWNNGDGKIGFSGPYGSGNGPTNGGCNAINSGLTAPPYDIIGIPNTAYTATQGPQIQDATIETCAAYCSVSPNCSGANFDISTKSCTLMSGYGSLTPTPNTFALIPKITQYLLTLSQLNFKLTQINDQIVREIKIGQPEFTKDNNDNKIENKLLLNRYNKLMIERKKIDEMINKIGNVQEEEYYEGNITSSTYLKYGLLLALVIIIFIILANISRSTTHINSDGTMQKSLLFVIFVIAFIVLGVVVMKNFIKTG